MELAVLQPCEQFCIAIHSIVLNIIIVFAFVSDSNFRMFNPVRTINSSEVFL